MAKSKPADKLAPYRAKREAARTPEPFGGSVPSRPGLFVVQKHAARSLHFDFRLELDGVLVSWAVPKGPSMDTADKRLAVHVEDHPLEYADFEGVIPQENYGAGSVIVWDRGLWTALEDPHAGMKKGKLLFDLAGYKLRGRFTLVRTKRSEKDWLLIKERDGHVRKGEELRQESVLSGLTVEELRDASAKTGEIDAELQRLKAPKRTVNAKEIEWMLAEAAKAPPDGEGWLFEIKYDGYRLLAAREDGRPSLRFRGGGDATSTFPEIARALAALPYDRVLVDGEVVVLDDDGKPSFGRLQKRGRLSRRSEIDRASLEHPAVLFAFDLLAFGDRDTRPLPLTERKRILQKVVPSIGPVRFADHFEGRGADFLEAARRMGLEGIVGKRASAPYRRGRSAEWVKVRFQRADDFVVVGFTEPKRGRPGFGALHLAVRDGEGYRYAGRVGTGFDDRQLGTLRERLDAERRDKPAATGALPKGREHVWTNPAIVVEVRYKEWTGDGQLRHPVFVRVRDDKTPEDCADDRGDSFRNSADRVSEAVPSDVDRTVRFTNLEKVFWPEEGHTKGDLIAYYRAIAPWILRYLHDRPLVMTRYPDGIHGKSFFQKDAPGFGPEWLRKERMWSEHGGREIDYFVCDDEPSLLYVINLGTIPLHVWSSRVPSLQRPDWCILDFDPKGAPFKHVVKLAVAAKALCDELELPAYLKTSGSTGLHVLIPLGRQCTFEESKLLAELLARVLAAEFPEIATIARALDARDGKVYIDFLQNGHGKLLVAPFSARPVPGAQVSTPLRWSEANARLDPSRFTIETVPGRMKKLKDDPLAPLLEDAPDLRGALERLGARLAR
ncbi:MAG TPA: DNA ligase D [Candidatus Polarisedimenticolaceae bacterium]|nr:DNA ligase D [Candidatus Polarisedimenticolaceae bacterium]